MRIHNKDGTAIIFAGWTTSLCNAENIPSRRTIRILLQGFQVHQRAVVATMVQIQGVVLVFKHLTTS